MNVWNDLGIPEFAEYAQTPEKKSAKLYMFPGTTKRDFPDLQISHRKILQDAIDYHVTDVVVVGRGRTGERYISSALGDIDRTVGILVGATTYLASANLVANGAIDLTVATDNFDNGHAPSTYGGDDPDPEEDEPDGAA